MVRVCKTLNGMEKVNRNLLFTVSSDSRARSSPVKPELDWNQTKGDGSSGSNQKMCGALCFTKDDMDRVNRMGFKRDWAGTWKRNLLRIPRQMQYLRSRKHPETEPWGILVCGTILACPVLAFPWSSICGQHWRQDAGLGGSYAWQIQMNVFFYNSPVSYCNIYCLSYKSS